jgi:hypothetical protein
MKQIHTAPILNKQTGLASSYKTSMWHPSRMSFNWNERNPKPPTWMYVGLQDIPALTSTTDTVTYQEGQVFIELECEMEGFTSFDTVTHGQTRKHYTDAVFSYNEIDVTLNDRGQGFIWGKPYSEES